MALLAHLNEDTKTEISSEIVNSKAFISNEILTALFTSATSTSIKLLFYIAQRTNTDTKHVGEYFKVKVDLVELCEKFEISKPIAIKHLKIIQDTKISFYEKEDKTLEDRFSFFSRLNMKTRSIIEIDIHEKIYAKINETKSNFSIIQVSNYQNKFNLNTMRMLMLVGYINSLSYENTKVTLEEFNYLFETKYTAYEFQRSVLDKTKKDLDNNSNLTFEYEKIEDMKITTGRPKTKGWRIKTTEKRMFQGILDLKEKVEDTKECPTTAEEENDNNN